MKIRRPKSASSKSAAPKSGSSKSGSSKSGSSKSASERAAPRSNDRDPVHVGGAMTAPTGPFSRQIDVVQAEDKALMVALTATPDECDEIARQYDVPAIAQFSAKFEVAPAGRGRFQVKGEVRARVTQICVVSLDPFESDIAQPVDVLFASPRDVEQAEAAYAKRHEEDGDGQDIPEPPDPIINGQIDLGLLACEQLVLALDPYPRKEGVDFAAEFDQVEEIAEVSPFAALAKLKKGSAEG